MIGILVGYLPWYLNLYLNRLWEGKFQFLLKSEPGQQMNDNITYPSLNKVANCAGAH
jgi:hypothetical protein